MDRSRSFFSYAFLKIELPVPIGGVGYLFIPEGGPKTNPIFGEDLTMGLTVRTNINIQDEKGNIKEKLFIKSINYNNNNNKSDLKKYENQSSEILANKISEEIIIYLQTI